MGTLKIKVCSDNAAAMNAELHAMVRRTAQNALSADDVLAGAAEAERQLADLGIAESARSGARWFLAGGQGASASSYRSAIATATAVLRRGGNDWFLVAVDRRRLYPKEKADTGLALSGEQALRAMATAVAGIDGGGLAAKSGTDGFTVSGNSQGVGVLRVEVLGGDLRGRAGLTSGGHITASLRPAAACQYSTPTASATLDVPPCTPPSVARMVAAALALGLTAGYDAGRKAAAVPAVVQPEPPANADATPSIAAA